MDVGDILPSISLEEDVIHKGGGCHYWDTSSWDDGYVRLSTNDSCVMSRRTLSITEGGCESSWRRYQRYHIQGIT